MLWKQSKKIENFSKQIKSLENTKVVLAKATFSDLQVLASNPVNSVMVDFVWLANK